GNTACWLQLSDEGLLSAPAVAGSAADASSCSCPVRKNSSPVCEAGGCRNVCTPGFVHCSDVEADGCEVDVANDPAHCGRCNRDCGGATCAKGRCGFMPVAVYGGNLGPFVLTANDKIAFMTTGEDSRIRECARSGCAGAMTTLDSSSGTGRSMAAASAGLFWAAGTDLRLIAAGSGTSKATLPTEYGEV